MNLVYLGSDLFSIQVFRQLRLLSNTTISVYTLDHQLPLALYCSQNNIPYSIYSNAIEGNGLIVASFGLFIPKHIIQQFDFTCNVHPSLLPK